MLLFLLSLVAARDSVDWFLVGGYNNTPAQKSSVFFLKRGEEIILYPVLDKGGEYYSPVKTFVLGNDTITPEAGIDMDVRWYAINPIFREYDNFHPRHPESSSIDPIEYVRSEPLCHEASFGFFQTFKDTVGTFYLTCTLESDENILGVLPSDSFSSIEPLHRRYPFKIIQVVVRADDSYIGYLTEMFNVPFTLPPKRTPGGWHQTDERMGSDCAEFAVYGKRRQGFEVPYVGPKGIYSYLEELSPSTFRPVKTEQGVVYLDKEDKPVTVGEEGIQPGDILHFGEQVSVFYSDQGVQGVLDKDDLVIQSYIPGTYITTIEWNSFYHLPLRVFKWKQKLPLINP